MASSKIPNTGFSIFSEMTKMANKYNAINMSQGFPDFDCSDNLKNMVFKAMSAGNNQYAPLEGVYKLREMISEKINSLYSYNYDPDAEITITSGATQAIFTAITAFVKENDEVIIIEPAFDTYEPSIKLNGGKPVYVKLSYPDYSINWEEIQRSLNSRTRMIIINTPHNPTGAIFTEEDMIKLQKITSGSKIIILSDEVYEHILFDGNSHQSVAKFPELADRSLLISSFGKTYTTTGWKTGYCCAPAELTQEFRKVHQLVVYAANTPIQMAYAEILQYPEEYLKMNDFYQKKRDLFINLLDGSNFDIVPSKGTYFQLLKYSKISNLNDIEFNEYLIKEVGVTGIPISAFYHEKAKHNVLRFCFAKNDDTLKLATDKLRKL